MTGASGKTACTAASLLCSEEGAGQSDGALGEFTGPAASLLCSEESAGQLAGGDGKNGPSLHRAGRRAALAVPAGKPAEPRSYLEIEVTPLRMSVFERSGDGQTRALLEALSRWGLRLREKVSSPCG